jgi:hypothetical protein
MFDKSGFARRKFHAAESIVGSRQNILRYFRLSDDLKKDGFEAQGA